MDKMLDMHMLAMHIGVMKLKSYLENSHMTDAEFGALIGVSQSQVNRIKHEKTNPSLEVAVAIERLTKGKVKARDFIDLPTVEAAE